jgi:VWFA-related protein
VDVVVRDKNGPIAGLTKDDFALYDCKSPVRICKGNRRAIDLFREVDALALPPTPPAISLAPGAVSNRIRGNGEPVSSATVVLVDQLNTLFSLKGYERLRVTEFLKSIGDKDRIALYSLGKDLHILQDFTDDPQKLMDAVAHIDSGDQLTFAQDDGTDGFGGMEAQALGDEKLAITRDAIRALVRHIEGIPGRKNLVWIGQQVPLADKQARFLLGQANIAVYPVMVRSLLGSGNIASSRAAPAPPGAFAIGMQLANQDRGRSLGGEGFGDAAEALTAVRAAEEDSKDYYVLGFYPAEADLDGATHQLTLDMSKKVSKRPDLTLQYRQVYLAAKPGAALQDAKPAVTDLLLSPLDATAIGLTASIEPDPSKPGARQIRTAIDLADLHLEREGERWTGSLEVSARLESKENGVILLTPTLTETLAISFTDAELQARRASGLVMTLPLPATARPGSAHIVVQDAATGTAGSVRIPIPVVFPQDP